MFPMINARSDLPMMASHLENETLETEENIFYVEPFVGWRAWDIWLDESRGRVRLQSITHKLKWPPKSPFRARCLVSRNVVKRGSKIHEAPNILHKCGIYSVKEQEDAAIWLGYMKNNKLRAMGEILIWGDIYKFTRGYLSEYAYPKSVYVEHEVPVGFKHDPREIVKELRRTYRGVEVKML